MTSKIKRLKIYIAITTTVATIFSLLMVLAMYGDLGGGSTGSWDHCQLVDGTDGDIRVSETQSCNIVWKHFPLVFGLSFVFVELIFLVPVVVYVIATWLARKFWKREGKSA